MWIGIAAAAAAVWLFLRSAYERRVFATDVYELWSDKIKRDRTFVFLSDLHDNVFGPDQRWLLKAVSRAEPDAVLIGGDMMVTGQRADTSAALFFVKELARRHRVYCGNGNHENRLDRERQRYGDQYDRYVEELRAAGVTYLSDDSAVLDEDVRISGLNLEKCYYEPRCPAALESGYIEKRLGPADRQRFQILLSHSPKFQRAYADWGADLTLSGHYHGGTIYLPVIGGLMTSQYEFFSKDCRGLHELDGRYMIVSRGLGTHSVNLRLNDMAQLVVVKVHRR